MYNWAMAPTSIYVHIPFCQQKCGYCDFNSFADKDEFIEAYVEALCKEMELQALYFAPDKNKAVKTVYIGGGTPSILSVKQISVIMETIRKRFVLSDDCEITMEVNPASGLTKGWSELAATGINRLSIGLQAYNDKLLKVLGRVHNQKIFDLTTEAIKSAGFTNLSCDLMIGLPCQTIEDIIYSLEHVLNMGYKHISVYSLIIEENTPFYRRYAGENQHLLPTEEEEREQQHLVQKFLKEKGWQHYEISNYALDGNFSRHNLSYWQGKTYYAFGAGAHSFVNGARRGSISDINEYIAKITASDKLNSHEFAELYPLEELVDITTAVKEYFLLGFRCMQGVGRKQFVKEFAKDIPLVLKIKLRKLENLGLIDNKADFWHLTETGEDFANQVFMEFI